MIEKRDTGSGSGRITSGFCMTPTKENAPPLSVSFPSRFLVFRVHSKMAITDVASGDDKKPKTQL